MLTPNTTPQDAAGAFAVLQVIADPKKAKERLDELTKLAEAANAAMQEARDKLKAAEDKEASLQGLESEALARSKALDKREADLKAGFEDLKVSTGVLNERILKHAGESAARDAELNAREMDVVEREKAVSVSERKLAKTLGDAEMLKAELERKAALLRE